MTDPRLYELVSTLASNQPSQASDMFKDMLNERTEAMIKDRVRNYQMKDLNNVRTSED